MGIHCTDWRITDVLTTIVFCSYYVFYRMAEKMMHNRLLHSPEQATLQKYSDLDIVRFILLLWHNWSWCAIYPRPWRVVTVSRTFLDFAKTSNPDDHRILCKKLCDFGIQGETLYWCEKKYNILIIFNYSIMCLHWGTAGRDISTEINRLGV